MVFDGRSSVKNLEFFSPLFSYYSYYIYLPITSLPIDDSHVDVEVVRCCSGDEIGNCVVS